MPKILIIEDNSDVRELLKTVLLLKEFEVIEFSTGRRGIAQAKSKLPDLIVLDLILPDIDGFEVCKILKRDPKTSKIPVIMLTARTEILDRVKGLELGADDYLVKPFEPLELLARIKVLLRRSGATAPEMRARLELGGFVAEPSNYRLQINAREVSDLTPKEFDVLYALMQNAPKTISRQDIFQQVWGKSQKDYTRVIDIHIAKIRKKLGKNASCIKTIPAKGYLFSPNLK